MSESFNVDSYTEEDQSRAARRPENIAAGTIAVVVLSLVVSACWIVLQQEWAAAKPVEAVVEASPPTAPVAALVEQSLPPTPVAAGRSAGWCIAELDAPALDAVQNEVPVDQLKVRDLPTEWKGIEALVKRVPEVHAGQAILEAGTQAALGRAGEPAQREAWINARAACIEERPDCAGLTFRSHITEADMDRARLLGGCAQRLRDHGVGDFSRQRDFRPFDLIDQWRGPDGIPALEQMLGAEEEAGRIALVRILARIRGSVASQALARRTLFDLSPTVRKEAIRYVSRRPPEEYRDILVQGLRYPWAPIARHASEALMEIKDRKVLPALLAQLDQGDPAAPVAADNGQWARPQLVRINHLRSCLLCHEPSLGPSSDRETLSFGRSLRSLDAPVPSVRQMLPPSQAYYAQRKSPTGIFVRLDIVYLRQDFSVTQVMPPSKESFWPRLQRYDYVVRHQPLTEEEACEWFADHAPEESPHRKMVLGVLRELTDIKAAR